MFKKNQTLILELKNITELKNLIESSMSDQTEQKKELANLKTF